MRAVLRYRTEDGKIVGGDFNDGGILGEGEAKLEWSHIPDSELYKVQDGVVVRRPDGEIESERERELLVTRQREAALRSLLLKEARLLGLSELEADLLDQPAL